MAVFVRRGSDGCNLPGLWMITVVRAIALGVGDPFGLVACLSGGRSATGRILRFNLRLGRVTFVFDPVNGNRDYANYNKPMWVKACNAAGCSANSSF